MQQIYELRARIVYAFPAISCIFLMIFKDILIASFGCCVLMILYNLPIIEQYGVIIMRENMLIVQANVLMMMTICLIISSLYIQKYYLCMMALSNVLHYIAVNYQVYYDILNFYDRDRIRKQKNSVWLVSIILTVLCLEIYWEKHLSKD